MLSLKIRMTREHCARLGEARIGMCGFVGGVSKGRRRFGRLSAARRVRMMLRRQTVGVFLDCGWGNAKEG